VCPLKQPSKPFEVINGAAFMNDSIITMFVARVAQS